ncbi:adhesin [Acerihabitans sp. TG2]|uniref:adhesin n=1 Tax=Acerihabitans sp. TG2 TaxID=3096008 RepID=UPI002B236725|nr:adhesin [Acerihabitans sp. TG2]MEA9393607.1 adhesin [Acerihabitans sp. TG2]
MSAGMANTAGIAILPGAAQAMWGLGAAANTGVRYFDGKDFSPVNASVAGWVNVVSMGHGLPGVVGWNAAGGALTNAINGDDPLTGAITNGAGSAFGYGMGQLAKVGVNAAGKYLTQGFDPKFHPNLLKYTEVKGQLGISKEMLPSKIPGAVGNVTSSISAEFSTDTADKSFKKAGDDENSPPK